MPVMEQKQGAMAQPSQGIANRLAIDSEKRLSTRAIAATPAEDDQVCWLAVNRYPYQPDHQVELLHLQAEADALLIKLQAKGQQQLNERSAAHNRSLDQT
jgi:hypothetical protein